jgi:rifampicin phosphotransferase
MRSRRSPAASWPAEIASGNRSVLPLGSGRVGAHGVGPKGALLDLAATRGLAVPRAVVVLAEADPPVVMTALDAMNASRYAVRSAFAAEDGDAASLAGWFDSFLQVPADDVVDAIARVRASADRRSGEFRRDVLVMAMVNAAQAGVAFSEPGTYEDLVNVTSGTAERLVAGEVEGDRVLLARLERTPAGWQRRLQGLLRAVRTEFGDEAWDVEWADDGAQCWLLQLRRVTRPTRRDESFTIANHAEILPALPSTLMTSVIAEAGPELFDWYRRRVPSLPEGRDFLEVIAGRPFINLSLLEDMLRDLGLPTRLVADSIGGPPVVDRPLRPTRVLRSAPSLIRLGWAQVTAVRTATRTFEALQEIAAQPMPTMTDALAALRRAYVGLVTGMFPLSSAIGPPLAVLRSAGSVHLHAARHRTITTELAEAVEQVRTGAVDLDEFLERFGHRGVYESDIARPRYADDPSVLGAGPGTRSRGARSRGARSHSARSHGADPASQSTGRVAMSDRIRRVLTLPVWWVARPPLAARERLRHEAMRAFAQIRTELVHLADAAVAARQLPETEALWLLTTNEARALDEGTVVTAEQLAARRAQRELLAALDPPPVVRRSDDPASWTTDTADGASANAASDTWRGLSLTTGTVRGRAWVLDEPVHVLPEGFDAGSTVLVARSIDAGWVTTLTQVAAAVIETGGDLSHGSILVREMGLPAITNVRGVRQGLRTGDAVEVRAAAGVVQRLNAAG